MIIKEGDNVSQGDVIITIQKNNSNKQIQISKNEEREMMISNIYSIS